MAEENTGGQGRIPREVARSRKERSAVWEHYDRITTADGKVKAKCKYCPKELAADSARHGTSTLWNHLETHGITRPQPREAPSESSNRKPGYKEACEDLARMIALRGYDSSVVQDDYFRSFVRRLDPAFEVPSRRTVEEMCDRLFDEAEGDLRDKLERARTSGRVNFAARVAKTIEGTVLCSACHFIDYEWNLREMIMHAELVVHRRDMRGPLLGISEFDLHGRASFRDMRGPPFDFAYQGNLFSVAWGIVSDHRQLKKLKNNLEDKFSDIYDISSEKATNIYHIYGQCASLDCSYMDIICNDDHGYSFCGITSLELTRQQREEHLLQLSLPDLWTYNERWYACYCSLEVVQKVRSSTIKEGDRTLRYIGERESEFARLLRKLWGTIYRAIQTISATNRPTSNLCLIELFKVREALESKLEMDSIDEANVDHRGFIDPERVPDVLSEAKGTLDRSIQESYLVWSIPLVLDPRYKLSYIESNFNNAFESGAAAYIKEVKTKIKEIFSDYNQADKQTSSGDSNCRPTMSVDSTYSLERYYPETEQQYDDSILRKRMEEMEIELKSSELDRYLEKDRVLETGNFNILEWWKDHSSTYPTVARMARDALAMPTCSKLSSELMSHIRSRIRGYSEGPFDYEHFSEEEEEEEEEE